MCISIKPYILYFLYALLYYLCIYFARTMCQLYPFLKKAISVLRKQVCFTHLGREYQVSTSLESNGGDSMVQGQRATRNYYETVYHSLSFSYKLNFLTVCFWCELVMFGLCHQDPANVASLLPLFVLRIWEGLRISLLGLAVGLPVPSRSQPDCAHFNHLDVQPLR